MNFSWDCPQLTLRAEGGVIQAGFAAEGVFRYAASPAGSIPAPCPGLTGSEKVKVHFEDREEAFVLKTRALKVVLDKATGLPAYYNARGRRILTALGQDFTPPEGEQERITAARQGGEGLYAIRADFALPADERFYGLGQHQQGLLDQRGERVLLWHDYKGQGGEIVGLPFLVSSYQYGVILDNLSRVTVDLGAEDPGRVRWTAPLGGALSYFVLCDEDYAGMYRGLRALMGQTPLPHKKALGYIQCKQRYQTQQEVEQVAQTYRDKGYPLDMMVVDWFHWKHLGDLDLDPAYWPDPAAMTAKLRDLGVETMISCWPRFVKESRHYDTLQRRGWFMQDLQGRTLYGTPEDQRGALIDTTDPDCAAWYWDAIRDSYAARGFTSWWLDEDEPDILPYGYHLHCGDGAQVHNLYPLTHTGAVYQGHRRDLPERCTILSRSAWFGAQAHGTTFWSSDIYPTWDTLRRQVPCGINFCASGFAWWSSDIGGWQALPGGEGDESYKSLLLQTEAQTDEGAALNYPELYVRWFEYGAFCPTFRAHGTRPENEVWSYGPEAEAILVKYLRLRYRLLPYLYALAEGVRGTGAPFMRGLFLDYPEDPACADIQDQYMFGPALLVAPVLHQGQRQRQVYLPEGLWYDFWTERPIQGGRAVTVEAPLDTLPLFVKAGSILPLQADCDRADAEGPITLTVYPGCDGTFDLYADDGRTYAYERGQCRRARVRWDDGTGSLTYQGDEIGGLNRTNAAARARVVGR